MTVAMDAPTATTAEAASQAVRHVSERPRFRTVPLEWPVEYDGKVWNEIQIRRLTTAEVGAFIDAIKIDGDKAFLPMFDAPQAVIDALDDDDGVAINEAVNDFLPRRLRVVADELPDPLIGEATLPSRPPG